MQQKQAMSGWKGKRVRKTGKKPAKKKGSPVMKFNVGLVNKNKLVRIPRLPPWDEDVSVYPLLCFQVILALDVIPYLGQLILWNSGI